jgi:Phosphodiester glycosidase
MRKRGLMSIWCLVFLLAPIIWLYATRGLYGINVVLHHGGSVWPTVGRDDPRLSPAVRLALSGKAGQLGKLTWAEPRPGFEVAELPILVDDMPVDRLLLARIDPAHWRFSVHSAPAGNRNLDIWMRELRAALIVNGSYFGLKGEPATPLISNGVRMGPVEYEASHGAFVASGQLANVVDLKGRDWRGLFAGKTNAMVSFPLLVDENGLSRAKQSEWLAGRSFVGQERSGKIIIGTTADAFLSLDRFAELLRSSPLDLVTALNLDGGPVACQAIDLGIYRRRTCGPQELQVEGNKVRLLQYLLPGDAPLPIVLAVLPL